ncbi:MAG: 2,3-bisphosphoglycerate-independent phosphoglycerate mutase [Candidatus Andersenbacteria bacterium]
MKHTSRPVVVLVLDGYGLSPVSEGNAVASAKQPHMEEYFQYYPWVGLAAAGIEVGLPRGEMGNSETGHQNIGSGRVLYQPLPRISLAIEDESFFSNPALVAAVKHVRKRPDAVLHTMGMVSDGGVHSHIDHQIALLKLAADAGLGDRTFVHAFLDGRDSPPDSAGNFINQLVQQIKELKAGRLASMVGRYYAMDRNKNWDRTRIAYDLLVRGEGEQMSSWQEALKSVFRHEEKRQSYETAQPIIFSDEDTPPRPIKDGDAVVVYNFREDRSVQLALALTKPSFSRFPVEKWQDLFFVTMTDYGHGVQAEVAFPAETITAPFGKVVSDKGLKQLRIAESEKFAHVTYFMNGGREKPFPGEKWLAIPSANVKDYSKKPHMSAEKISEAVIQSIQAGKHDLIVANYANPDMIAHTSNFPATVNALEFLDDQIGRVVESVLAAQGTILITGDHGNAEDMMNRLTGESTTDHTTNPVPLIYITPKNRRRKARSESELEQLAVVPVGILADVAPTILDVLGLKTPSEMTSQSLLSSLR